MGGGSQYCVLVSGLGWSGQADMFSTQLYLTSGNQSDWRKHSSSCRFKKKIQIHPKSLKSVIEKHDEVQAFFAKYKTKSTCMKIFRSPLKMLDCSLTGGIVTHISIDNEYSSNNSSVIW